MRFPRRAYAVSIGVFIAFALLAINLVHIPFTPAQASERHTDVLVTLDVPAEAHTGEDFTFSASIGNQGPDAADGTTFTLDFERSTTNLSIECTPTERAASCPTNIKILLEGKDNPPRITGRIDSLPTNAKVEFKIKGKFPAVQQKGSASTLFRAEAPEGSIDNNPQTNSVTQQTALSTPPRELRISVEQDKEITAAGEPRTYTITYENIGAGNVVPYMNDVSYFYYNRTADNRTNVPYSYSYECDANASSVECPKLSGSHSGKGDNASHYWYKSTVLPPGKKIVMKVTLTVAEGRCGQDNRSIFIHNRPSTFSESPEALIGEVRLPNCPKPSVSVTKVQDKEQVEFGQPHTYTVLYENTGKIDANIHISDSVKFVTNGKDNPLPFSFSYECDSTESTIDCQDFSGEGTRESGGGIFNHANVLLPPGKKLSLKARLTIAEDACVHEDSVTTVRNTASASIWPKELLDSRPLESIHSSVSGSTIVPACPRPSVTVTKEQNKEITTIGEERIYTVTYENTGKIDAKVYIKDRSEFNKGSEHVPFASSYECDATASTMECPDISGSSEATTSQVWYWNKAVTIPAGKKLVLRGKLTIKPAACTAEDKEIHIYNEAEVTIERGRLFSTGKRTESTSLMGTVTIPACPRISATVSKKQDKELTSAGEKRTYTVTYENTSNIPAKFPLGDTAYFYKDSTLKTRLAVPFEYAVSCDSNVSTATCPRLYTKPNHVNKNENKLFSTQVEIPAGKTLVFNVDLTLTPESCPLNDGDIFIKNVASIRTPAGFVFTNTERGVLSQEVIGRVRCVDVSTLTTLSNPSPKVGDKVSVDTQVSNSMGLAEDVPFKLVLSTDEKSGKSVNVLETTPDAISCEVENGDATCPDEFTYDKTTNTITATIPRMPKGSSLRIRANTELTSAAKYLKSYDVFAEAPGVFGDRALGTEGTNRSATTFSWTEIIKIPIPPAPLDDRCGPNNATWNIPENTDLLKWTLDENGHLSVNITTDGYTFEDGTTTHDYGTAPDSGIQCATVPATPSVTDPCGANNATWNIPEGKETTNNLEWISSDEGRRLSVNTKDGYAFEDGTTTHDYGTAPDSGKACEQPSTPTPDPQPPTQPGNEQAPTPNPEPQPPTQPGNEQPPTPNPEPQPPTQPGSDQPPSSPLPPQPGSTPDAPESSDPQQSGEIPQSQLTPPTPPTPGPDTPPQSDRTTVTPASTTPPQHNKPQPTLPATGADIPSTLAVALLALGITLLITHHSKRKTQ